MIIRESSEVDVCSQKAVSASAWPPSKPDIGWRSWGVEPGLDPNEGNDIVSSAGRLPRQWTMSQWTLGSKYH